MAKFDIDTIEVILGINLSNELLQGPELITLIHTYYSKIKTTRIKAD